MELHFYGAAGEVTGSCHLIKLNGYRILLDCGLIQGGRTSEAQNEEPFPFDTKDIDAVILSHAHIDHSGRIPLLVKRGFTGPIYAQKATKSLCRIMLKDAAFLNEKDAEWENKKRQRKGLSLVQPLYDRDDAKAAMRQFRALPYEKITTIVPGIKVRLQDAGHILGSSIVELWLEDKGVSRKIVFSGDLGQSNMPILRNPVMIEEADLVLMESTYGDRLHRPFEATLLELKDIFTAANKSSGNIVIPSFAVGRTQLLLYLLSQYSSEWGLDNWHIFLDSPMAIEATEVYDQYTDLYDQEATSLWRNNGLYNRLPNLHFCRTTNQSMAINRIESGAIIIAGSGMCTGGRIKHHLKNNIWRKNCHLIIPGFQAAGTTGRALVDGARRIRLWAETVKVSAQIHTIGGLSAHADQKELIDWYNSFKNQPPLMLVHGEEKALDALLIKLQDKTNAKVRIARPRMAINLVNMNIFNEL
ncbi:MAG: metallo-beta-lactamase family protein [Gammaproteobacteria bacterium]|jgi:metallo-beta-lactamase family protein